MAKTTWILYFTLIITAAIYGIAGCSQPGPEAEDLTEVIETTINDEVIDDTTEKEYRDQELLKEIIDAHSGMHEANQEKGFYWPYLLYIPDNLEVGEEVNILVLPNGSPPSDSLDDHIKEAEIDYNDLGKVFAYELKVVTLIPVVPSFDKSPYPDAVEYGWINAQLLKVPSIRRAEGEIYQFDLQVLAMINDARGLLEAKGLQVNELFCLFGFSNGGVFTSRMLLLHPEKIQAAAFGGASFPSVPVSEWNGVYMPYPSGTGGLEDIIGKEFDLEAYNYTPIFVFRGSEDDNDFYEFSKPSYITALGKTPRERNAAAKEIYEQTGSNIEFRFYDAKHELKKIMLNDVFDFFIKHLTTK